MRAIWKGSIAFGLVNIPINVYPASEEHALEFHMLHKDDLSPIRFARICKSENREIPYSEIVKGYEYEKDAFVVIDEADFKQADAKKTSTIEIQHFTNIDQINPIYFEKPYFLEPDKKSGKAYKLLHEALVQSKKVAIANFVFRQREHIGAILPFDDGLQLIQMRFHVEIRSFEKLEIPKEKITAAELKMALSFVDQLSKPFEAEKFHDTYVESLMAVIQKKMQGKKTVRAPKEAKMPSEARDLMDLLQASMKKAVAETDQRKKTKQRVKERPLHNFKKKKIRLRNA